MAVAKAKDFLESNTYSADDPYTSALSAYALALLRSPYAPLALRRLNHMAITQGTGTRCTNGGGQEVSLSGFSTIHGALCHDQRFQTSGNQTFLFRPSELKLNIYTHLEICVVVSCTAASAQMSYFSRSETT